MSVIRFGVPRENVVATIEIPKSHHGILRLERKKLAESLPPLLLVINPIAVKITIKMIIIIQSILFNAIRKDFSGNCN
jgi:hypothetical protein